MVWLHTYRDASTQRGSLFLISTKCTAWTIVIVEKPSPTICCH